LLVGGGIAIGYQIGHRSVVASSEAVDLGVFWQTWRAIDKKFFGTIDNEKRVDGAISGMVAGLGDPYTVYLPPVAKKQFEEDLQGSFGGIGAELNVKNGQLVIVSALSDTPAEAAGLLPNDIILKIDDAETAKLTMSEAIDRIRGEVGTKVSLSIQRATSEEPLLIEVTRATITVKSVKVDTIGAKNDIAYIKVNQFGQDTATDFRAALVAAKQAGRKGLVIDFRNNPGGYLASAVQMLGMLLPETTSKAEPALQRRVAVLEKGKKGDREDVAGHDIVWDSVPLVVLVNGGSASASEIFAGAIKDYGRGTVLGSKTFGKGSVQELQDLANGGSIKVTIAKWFTPLGTGIDGTGIAPETVVDLPEGTIPSTTDAQVAAALAALAATP
jgi:carboxyl-terminal processing protease